LPGSPINTHGCDVVTAALQRAVDESGIALFLLKGGTTLRANDSLSIINPVRVRADVLYIRSEREKKVNGAGNCEVVQR